MEYTKTFYNREDFIEWQFSNPRCLLTSINGSVEPIKEYNFPMKIMYIKVT